MPGIITKSRNFWNSRSKKQKWIIVLALLIIISAGSGNSSKSSSGKTSSESINNQNLQKGVMPNLVGINVYDAVQMLDKSDYAPMYRPTSFELDIAKNSLETDGKLWFVCKQETLAGSKSDNPGYTTIHVSKDCTNWGSMPNAVGMKAAAAWQLLINRGFSPTYNSEDSLTSEQENMDVCSQDQPEGSQKIDETVHLDIYSDCSKSPNNPDSRDGTRIFINDSLKDIADLQMEIGLLRKAAIGDHKILIQAPNIAMALKASYLSMRLAPSDKSVAWKKANDDFQTTSHKFDKALSDWVDSIINTREFLPYIDALNSPVNNLKAIIKSIPYPK